MKEPAYRNIAISLAIVLTLAACETAPPVETSRQMLWSQFGNQSIDNVLLAWGPPMGETRLTNGTRMINYTRNEIYNDGWATFVHECKVSFFAPKPDYKINNITLDGEPYDCYQLAQGRTGTKAYFRPYYPPPWRPYPYYM